MTAAPNTLTLTPAMQALRGKAEARGLAATSFEEHGRSYLRIGNAETFRNLEIVASTSRDTGRISHAATFDGRSVSLKDAEGYISLLAI